MIPIRTPTRDCWKPPATELCQINAITLINQNANIEAIGANATVILQSSTIQGGTLTNSGGLFDTPASVGATLDGSTQGQITLVGTYTAQANSTTVLVGTINNTGTIFVNANAASNVVLNFSNVVTLTGAGTMYDGEDRQR